MSFQIAEAFVSVKTQLDKGSLDEMERDVTSRLDSIGGSMQKWGAGLTAGITLPVVGLGLNFINAASDAEEMRGKFGTVFGELEADAEQWASVTAEALNRSRYDLMGYMSSFQDTFVPFGFARDEAMSLSQEVTQLGVDLASFNNMAEPEVMQSLTSALIGNHGAVQKFGVIINQTTLEQELMNMGIEGGVNAATEQEKVLARLNIIMRSTTDAQGDAARTSDSYANQMRGLKAAFQELSVTFGDILLPMATDLVGAIRPLVEGFTNLSEGTQKFIVGGAGIAAAVGPLLMISGSVVRNWQILSGALGKMSTMRIGNIGLGALGTQAQTAGGAAPGVGRLAANLKLIGAAAVGLWAVSEGLGAIATNLLNIKAANPEAIALELQKIAAGEHGELLPRIDENRWNEAAVRTLFGDTNFANRITDAILPDKINWWGKAATALEQDLLVVSGELARMVDTGQIDEARRAYEEVEQQLLSTGVDADLLAQKLPGIFESFFIAIDRAEFQARNAGPDDPGFIGPREVVEPMLPDVQDNTEAVDRNTRALGGVEQGIITGQSGRLNEMSMVVDAIEGSLGARGLDSWDRSPGPGHPDSMELSGSSDVLVNTMNAPNLANLGTGTQISFTQTASGEHARIVNNVFNGKVSLRPMDIKQLQEIHDFFNLIDPLSRQRGLATRAKHGLGTTGRLGGWSS